MKFKINRTSRKTPPCEGAELEEFVYPNSGKRDSFYTIDIEMLGDLLAFSVEVGSELVVSNEDFLNQYLPEEMRYPSIEIYDDYRE